MADTRHTDHIEARSAPRGLLTAHARERAQRPGLSTPAFALAMDLGRRTHLRGVGIRAIGRKEVDRHRAQELDLNALEGFHPVRSTDCHVITTDRSHDLHGLRPRARRCAWAGSTEGA